MRARLIAGAACACALLSVPAARAQKAPAWDTYSDTWVGVDGLGRALPTFEDVGPPKPNKQAGIFYFLWVDGRTGVVNDNDKILRASADGKIKYEHGAWGWWGEPLLGFYKIDDPFVLRKHAQMLKDAGVDTLIFDSSNGYLHEDQLAALCHVYGDIRKTGQTTPQFAHLTNNQASKTVQKAYNEFYSKNVAPDLWYRWLGKPLLLTRPTEMTPQLADYFSIRQSWAWSGPHGWFGNGQDKWPWLDNYPQNYGWHTDPSKPEEISVCIAQHATTSKGRSFHSDKEPPPAAQKPENGAYFDDQWSRALKVNPDFVFVTGWNEWIAPMQAATDKTVFTGRHLAKGDGFFVDEYSPEFSRDAEPMAGDGPGDFGDNYYYQLTANLRRYKGVRSLPPVPLQAMPLNGGFAAWSGVTPEFRDDIGDPVHRDFDGFAKGSHFTNTTGRNDIVASKVTFDRAFVYVYVRTREPLTPHTDPNWMLLLLNTDKDYRTGWLGYDFVINRQVGSTTTSLERQIGGPGAFQWEKVADVRYQARGREMMVAIPRALIGFGDTIDFKWADNCLSAAPTWRDFTLNGDAAPNDRFNYRARLMSPTRVP
jgi:hypothetical protein